MKVVIDTNVLMSGIFFKGNPNRVLAALDENQFEACANENIVIEYKKVLKRLKKKLKRTPSNDLFQTFIDRLNIFEAKSNIKICRDPDDDKFIECALDSKALYIVSGDKDLLSIEEYNGVEIITAAEFCEHYL